MILDNQQTKSLLDEDGTYQYSLIRQRFASLFFGEEVSPIGNVIVFEAKSGSGPLCFNKALIVAAELPNSSIFAGVCFQRLYATQLGSLLSMITGKQCFVDESCIFADGLQSSIALTSKFKDSVLFHIIFPIKTDRKEFFDFSLKEEDMQTFKVNAVESFKHLSKSIFLETQRDNF
jgi:hypothetical protein